MFWAEELYSFDESVRDALTMLQTNSSFSEAVNLTASPQKIVENLTVVTFESTITFAGQQIQANSSIEFVNYNGIQYGVGIVGK